MGSPVKYLGFIRANEDDEDFLRLLGVEGNLKYKDGNFEMCEIPVEKATEIVPELKKYFPSFSTVVFTGVDKNGKNVCGMNFYDYSPSYRGEWRRPEHR